MDHQKALQDVLRAPFHEDHRLDYDEVLEMVVLHYVFVEQLPAGEVLQVVIVPRVGMVAQRKNDVPSQDGFAAVVADDGVD